MFWRDLSPSHFSDLPRHHRYQRYCCLLYFFRVCTVKRIDMYFFPRTRRTLNSKMTLKHTGSTQYQGWAEPAFLGSYDLSSCWRDSALSPPRITQLCSEQFMCLLHNKSLVINDLLLEGSMIGAVPKWEHGVPLLHCPCWQTCTDLKGLDGQTSKGQVNLFSQIQLPKKKISDPGDQSKRTTTFTHAKGGCLPERTKERCLP